MAFTQTFGPGEGFASKLAETVREALSKGFSGADFGGAKGVVELKFVPDFTAMETGFKESLGRIQTSSGGHDGQSSTILGMILDEMRASRKATEVVADAAKGGGAGGGTAPMVPGEPGIDLPGTSSGLFGNRKSMAGWEVQRAMSDPTGFVQGSVMNGLLQKAGGLAMGGAWSGLSSMGLAGGAALGGAALYAGSKAGDMINTGTMTAGERDIRARIGDSNLSGDVGLDFRGITFDDKRLRPSARMGDAFNYAYSRSGLGAMGVNLGDMADVDKAGMPGFMSQMGVSAHRFGYSQEAMSGILGQSWASGAADKTLAGSTALLKNIEEAVREGHAIGIKGNETLQTVSTLMQMEQGRTGVVSHGAMGDLIGTAEGLGAYDKHLFGGNKAAGILGAIGQSSNPFVRGAMLSSMLDAHGNLTHSANARFHAMYGTKFDKEAGYDKADILADDPDAKIDFAKNFMKSGNMPLSMLRELFGAQGIPKSLMMGFRAAVKGGLRHKDSNEGTWAWPAVNDEENLGMAGHAGEFAQTGADSVRMQDLLRWEITKAEIMLSASEKFNAAVTKFAEAVFSGDTHHPDGSTPAELAWGIADPREKSRFPKPPVVVQHH